MDKWHRQYETRRWREKRDEIIKRDKNECTVCGSKHNLQVHHTFYYIQETPPWDYPNDSLLTICKECHEEWHKHSELVYVDKNKKKKPKSKTKVKQGKQPPKFHKKRMGFGKCPSWAEVQRERIDSSPNNTGSVSNKYRKFVNGEWVTLSV